jgi:uncharacterized protein HemY
MYAQINYAQSLGQIASDRGDLLGNVGNRNYYQRSTEVLNLAIAHAKSIQDRRSLAYALGHLANVDEQTGQLDSAQKLSEEALAIAQLLDAPDMPIAGSGNWAEF